MKTPAFFLDRDGTIIEDKGYICKFSEVEVFPWAIEAVRKINNRGFKVIVVTNQSSVARGICLPEEVELLHQQIREYFAERKAIIDTFYYCPFFQGGTVSEYARPDHCRKPLPGMLVQAARELNIDLPASYMIGDKITDLQAGRNAGCQTVLVKTGLGAEEFTRLSEYDSLADFVTDDLLAAVEQIFLDNKK